MTFIPGCKQSLERGIIPLNLYDISSTPLVGLAKGKVLKDYGDCFYNIRWFSVAKYHITLIKNPKLVVHTPLTVPVHISPLYKSELEKMLDEKAITPVSKPTD